MKPQLAFNIPRIISQEKLDRYNNVRSECNCLSQNALLCYKLNKELIGVICCISDQTPGMVQSRRPRIKTM